MPKTWFFDPLKADHYGKGIIDVPSKFKNRSAFEGTKGPNYPTMSDADIRALPVKHLCAADCLILQWATLPKLPHYIAYGEAWGLRYVTGGAWFKRTRTGKISYTHGHVLQGGAELWLLWALGQPIYADRPAKGVIETTEEEHDEELRGMLRGIEGMNGLRRENSRKPDEQYALMDFLMGDVPGFELFGRQVWPGYDGWGNELGKYQAEAAR